MRKLSILFTPIILTLFGSGAIYAQGDTHPNQGECDSKIKIAESDDSLKNFNLSGSHERSFQ